MVIVEDYSYCYVGGESGKIELQSCFKDLFERSLRVACQSSSSWIHLLMLLALTTLPAAATIHATSLVYEARLASAWLTWLTAMVDGSLVYNHKCTEIMRRLGPILHIGTLMKFVPLLMLQYSRLGKTRENMLWRHAISGVPKSFPKFFLNRLPLLFIFCYFFEINDVDVGVFIVFYFSFISDRNCSWQLNVRLRLHSLHNLLQCLVQSWLRNYLLPKRESLFLYEVLNCQLLLQNQEIVVLQIQPRLKPRTRIRTMTSTWWSDALFRNSIRFLSKKKTLIPLEK